MGTRASSNDRIRRRGGQTFPPDGRLTLAGHFPRRFSKGGNLRKEYVKGMSYTHRGHALI